MGVKTAISIPDDVFERAEAQAKALGMSRSEFYVSAIELHLERMLGDDLTRRINEALDVIGDSYDEEAADWAEHSRWMLTRDGEEW